MIYQVKWRSSKKLQSDLSTSKKPRFFFRPNCRDEWIYILACRYHKLHRCIAGKKKGGRFLLLKMKDFWLQVNSLEPKSSVPSRPNWCQNVTLVLYWETNSKVVQMYKGYLICFVWHSWGLNECLSVTFILPICLKKKQFSRKMTCRAFVVKQRDSFSFTNLLFCNLKSLEPSNFTREKGFFN